MHPQDPRVGRRTLTIFGVFFGGGILLSLFWMTKEVKRVLRIERSDVWREPAVQSAPVTPPPASVRTNGMIRIPGGTFLLSTSTRLGSLLQGPSRVLCSSCLEIVGYRRDHLGLSRSDIVGFAGIQGQLIQF